MNLRIDTEGFFYTEEPFERGRAKDDREGEYFEDGELFGGEMAQMVMRVKTGRGAYTEVWRVESGDLFSGISTRDGDGCWEWLLPPDPCLPESFEYMKNRAFNSCRLR